MNLFPKPRNHMEGPMHPIHPEGQQIVIGHQSHRTVTQGRDHVLSDWIVARDGIVQTHVESELADQREPDTGLIIGQIKPYSNRFLSHVNTCGLGLNNKLKDVTSLSTIN